MNGQPTPTTEITAERKLSDLVYLLGRDASQSRDTAKNTKRRLYNALSQYEDCILPGRDYDTEDQLSELVIQASREAADAIESGEDTDTVERRVWSATDGNLPNLAAEWITERTRDKMEGQTDD